MFEDNLKDDQDRMKDSIQRRIYPPTNTELVHELLLGVHNPVRECRVNRKCCLSST